MIFFAGLTVFLISSLESHGEKGMHAAAAAASP
jgi:hypothetical protein